MSIKVGDITVTPTPSEKLLGVIISEDLTWDPHLWGEVWRDSKNWTGVIPQLIQRLGLLKHLARISSRKKLQSFIPAMLTSKILYALPLVGSVWSLNEYSDREPNKTAFTKSHLQKMQSLQRQAALLLRPPEPSLTTTPTKDLLDQAGWLSIHQLIVFTTLSLTLRVMQNRKPAYLADLLQPAVNSRTRNDCLVIPRCRLNLTLEGFSNQACRLYNRLPEKIKQETNKASLKVLLKAWIRENICLKY